ncbi:MAG: hypothetical protein N2446_02165 [Elusimicrobiales bacterium]|nr:hypothetical protein [Elusimicrobiales bacterium]
MDSYLVIRTKYGVLTVPKSEIVNSKNQVNIFENSDLKISIEKSREGFIRRFYNNGVITATQTISFDGIIVSSSGFIKDGIYYEYDESGNIVSERFIKNGVENGVLTEFYRDGRVKARIDYKDGKVDGKAIFYNHNSKPVLERSYSKGVLDGFSIEYDLEGNVKSKVLYSLGKIVTENELLETKQINDKKVEISSENNVYDVKLSTTNIELDKVVKKDISSRIINIARGKKIFVYEKKKYIGSFSYDLDYNIIDLTGNIPDGYIEVFDRKTKLVFEFFSNWPVSLIIIEDGKQIAEFNYDKNGKATRK